MGKTKDLPLYSKNLKYLRKKANIKLVPLGRKINLAPNTISQYENGHRRPDDKTIAIFASFFGVEASDIVYTDLQKKDESVDVRIKAKSIIQLINVMFPLIKTKSALDNENFFKGYQYSLALLDLEKSINKFVEEITKSKKQHSDLHKSDFSMIIKEVIEKDNPEATQNFIMEGYNYFLKVDDERIKDIVSANILRLLFFLYITRNQDISNLTDISEDGTITYSVESEKTKVNSIVIENHNKFSHKYLDEILSHIQILKKNTRTAELGDFYLALLFILNLFPFDKKEDIVETSTEFSKIGYGMIFAFDVIENKYAEKYLDFIQSIEDLV